MTSHARSTQQTVHGIQTVRVFHSVTSQETEMFIASCKLVVVMITESCLQSEEMIFIMEICQLYKSIAVLLIHDPNSCAHPSIADVLSPVARDLLLSNTITHIEGTCDSQ